MKYQALPAFRPEAFLHLNGLRYSERNVIVSSQYSEYGLSFS